VEVIQHLDGLGESAAIMGAVNCAVNRGGKLIGENTDGKGFLKSLLEVVDPKGKSIVMFGAGGAARAIGVELALAGAKSLTIVNRTAARAEPLVKLLNEKTKTPTQLVVWPKAYRVPDGTDIVVNATSIGLANGNPTVAMIEAAFRHHGLNWRYVNCEVPPERLADAVKGARAMGWRGFNLSIPHKVAVIPLLDGLGESAAIMGAVNCAVNRDGKFIGENTDGKGFLKSLLEVVAPRGRSVVMFGAGGAARAIGVELALAGARSITVVNRSAARGEPLVKLLNEKTHAPATLALWDKTYVIPKATDIVVNATSIGLGNGNAPLDIDVSSLTPAMVVADVIVDPPDTRFLRDAKAQGCITIDGLGMLINQGVIGVKYWTGLDADPAAMRRKLEEIFAN
jgi:shikimate dehydrogenase